jgi:hypothetical protein
MIGAIVLAIRLSASRWKAQWSSTDFLPGGIHQLNQAPIAVRWRSVGGIMIGICLFHRGGPSPVLLNPAGVNSRLAYIC